jgi:allophanate hydrolase
VLAASCKDALDVLDAIEGPDPGDPYSRNGRGAWFSAQDFRFAVPAQLEFHGDSDYARLFAQAILKLRQLGGTPVEVDYGPFREAQDLLYGPWVAERTALLEQHLDAMLPVTREIIEGGRKYSAVDLFRAQQRLWELMLEARKLFQKADVLLTPTTPTIYRIADLEAKPIELNSRLGYYTQATNLLDLAAVSVPAGLRPDGLPFGIQLTGPAFSERALAALGARFLGEAIKP